MGTYFCISCYPYSHGGYFQDWRSALGAILWVVVAVVFTTLTHLAGLRHRQRHQMDLTTPDGVEALLDVRWRQDKDDTIQIYHRNAHQQVKNDKKQPPPPPGPIYEQTYNAAEVEQLVRWDSSTEFI